MRPIDADAYAAEMKKRQDACWRLLDEAKKYGGVSFEGIDRLNEIYATFSEAKLVLDDMPTIGGWINVKDKLPEEPGRYLCWFGKNTFAVGASIVPYIPDLHWFASLESLERYENVTHWMPLPEPPEEERSVVDDQTDAENAPDAVP